jgi:predicted DNA-binding WGR domain protein
MAKEVKYYLCKSAQHNKYYRTERDGLKLTLSWGRVGGSSAEQVLDFATESELEKFLAKKLKDKLRPRKEGQYVETQIGELRQEEEVAKTLGQQYKISRFEFVDLQLSKKKPFGPQVDAGTLKILQNYDANKFVYAEVMNSWTKDITHLVINKDQAWQLKSIAESKAGGTMAFDRRWDVENKLVAGVRMVLKRIAASVIAALKKFGDLGGRRLGDDDGPSTSSNFDWGSLEAETGASKQVLQKFGNLGSRVLDI